MRFAADNISDCPVVNALHKLHERGTIANLESHIQTEFAFRALANLDHLQCAGHVHGDGLLHIDMFSRADDGFQMLRMIIGGRGDHYCVHFFGGRHLLISLGANENLRSVNRCVALALLHLVEMFLGVVQLILEHVGQRDNASAAGVNHIRCVLGAPTATAEQAYAHRGIRCRAAHQRRLDQHRPSRNRGYFNKSSAVDFI